MPSTMPDQPALEADYAALNDLIVNCPDFHRLESLLGGFNLFQVLKFEHGEIRHSNVLAWILDPAESHGLDSLFLKKWLMRVMHESGEYLDAPVTAVDIDTCQLVSVEVRREWRNIDLLLILELADHRRWVVCIENKVNSTQHSNQLSRYRQVVEASFPDATRRIFLLLTKDEKMPEDPAYLNASYAQVHRVLKECLGSRSHAIGAEPKVLLENYLRLLEEKFMDESEIARTALRIYQQHRRALDIIFENRPDNLRLASDRVRRLLTEKADEIGIVMEPCSKVYLRFVPRAWDQPGNTHGTGWSGTNRTILFELNLTGNAPYLYVTAGKAPDDWIDPLWRRVGSYPFRAGRVKRNTRPRYWCMLHVAAQTKISLGDEDVMDPDEMAQKIFDWCVAAYREPQTQEVIRVLAAELPKLERPLVTSPG
jgi:hypothetical protein